VYSSKGDREGRWDGWWSRCAFHIWRSSGVPFSPPSLPPVRRSPSPLGESVTHLYMRHGWTNMPILWNPIYKAFHQICCCGIWCGSCVCMTWRGRVCDMTHTCMWRNVYVWCAFYMSVACLIHMCDINHLHLCCESYICVTWFMCLCMTWCTHMCVVVHPCVWHGSYIWVGAVSHASIGHVDRIRVFDSCMISHLVGVPRLKTLSIMYIYTCMYVTHI